MLNNVDYELHEKRWYMTEENYRKIFRLLMETRVLIYFFCDHSINRWIKIEPGFIFINYKERVGDEYTDFDDFLFHGTDVEEYSKEEIEYLAKEFEDNIQGNIIFQDPCEAFGYCAGKWYTNIIKHDFPELFV